MSTTYQWGILVGILVGIVIVAAIFWFNKKTTGTINGGDFDERQQLLRGKAFQKGFLMMLILSGVYWVVVELILQRPLMKDGLSGVVIALLSVGVFGIDCILHDAFFTVKNKPVTYIALFSACTLAQVPSAISNIRSGSVLENGVLTFSVLPIVCAVVFLGILFAIIVKRALPEKEED